MRRVFVATALIGCLCLLGCPAAPSASSKSIVGKWTHDDGNIVSTFEFTADNVCIWDSASMHIKGTYSNNTAATPNEIYMTMTHYRVDGVDSGWVESPATVKYSAIYELLSNDSLKIRLAVSEEPPSAFDDLMTVVMTRVE